MALLTTLQSIPLLFAVMSFGVILSGYLLPYWFLIDTSPHAVTGYKGLYGTLWWNTTTNTTDGWSQDDIDWYDVVTMVTAGVGLLIIPFGIGLGVSSVLCYPIRGVGHAFILTGAVTLLGFGAQALRLLLPHGDHQTEAASQPITSYHPHISFFLTMFGGVLITVSGILVTACMREDDFYQTDTV